MRIETLAVHSGRSVDAATGAVTPAIHMSTTFEREPDGTYPQGFVYGRSGNPTRTLLAECVRDLEGGEGAAAFSSGAAALAAVFDSLATGDRVIAPQDLYHGTALLLRGRLARWGLRVSFVDMTDIDAIREAITSDTKRVFPKEGVSKVIQAGANRRSMRWVMAMYTQDSLVDGKAS